MLARTPYLFFMQLRWDEIRVLVLVALGQLCLELRYVSTWMMKYGTTYAACLIQIRSAVNGLLVLSPGKPMCGAERPLRANSQADASALVKTSQSPSVAIRQNLRVSPALRPTARGLRARPRRY